jgi:hypothetical protein
VRSTAIEEVTCRQLVGLVTDYFERALDERTLDRVEEHLVMCDACTTYVVQIKLTIGALATLRGMP